MSNPDKQSKQFNIDDYPEEKKEFVSRFSVGYQDFLDLARYVPVHRSWSLLDRRSCQTPGGRKFLTLLEWAAGSWQESAKVPYFSPVYQRDDGLAQMEKADWSVGKTGLRWTTLTEITELKDYMERRMAQPIMPHRSVSLSEKEILGRRPAIVVTHQLNRKDLEWTVSLLNAYKAAKAERGRRSSSNVWAPLPKFKAFIDRMVGDPHAFEGKGPIGKRQKRMDELLDDSYRDFLEIDLEEARLLSARDLRHKNDICRAAVTQLARLPMLGREFFVSLRRIQEREDVESLELAKKLEAILKDYDRTPFLKPKNLRRRRTTKLILRKSPGRSFASE